MNDSVDNQIDTSQVNQPDDGATDVAESEGQLDQDTQATRQETPASSSQSFTDKFDPNKLPKELLPAYKQMQADYTRKTQEIAEIRKFYDAYSPYQPIIDYLAQNPQILDKLAELEGSQSAQQQPETQEQVEYPDDPVEYAKVLKEEAKKEAINEFLGILQQQQEAFLAQQALEEDIAQAEKLDERLATDETFSKLVLNAVLSNPDVLAGRMTYTEATKRAIEEVDAMLNSKIESEKQKLTKMAQEKKSTYVPSSNAKVVSDSYPQTIEEAARKAGLIS